MSEAKSPIWNQVYVECGKCGRMAAALFRTSLCCTDKPHGIVWGAGMVLEWREAGVSLKGWILPFHDNNHEPTAFCGDCRQ